MKETKLAISDQIIEAQKKLKPIFELVEKTRVNIPNETILKLSKISEMQRQIYEDIKPTLKLIGEVNKIRLNIPKVIPNETILKLSKIIESYQESIEKRVSVLNFSGITVPIEGAIKFSQISQDHTTAINELFCDLDLDEAVQKFKTSELYCEINPEIFLQKCEISNSDKELIIRFYIMIVLLLFFESRLEIEDALYKLVESFNNLLSSPVLEKVSNMQVLLTALSGITSFLNNQTEKQEQN